MILGKISVSMTMEIAIPLPGLTRAEAEAEVNTDAAKASFAQEITQHLTKTAEAGGGTLTVSETSITIVEV